MALVTCPGCSKRVSDVLSMCPNCGHVRGEVDDERMVEMKRRGLRDRIYHLKMISYVVISLFLVAFGWYWWDTEGFLYRSSMGPLILTGIAAIQRELPIEVVSTLEQAGERLAGRFGNGASSRALVAAADQLRDRVGPAR